MTEAQRIADLLKKSIDGEAWHGPSVFDALEDITAEQAASHPIESAHSIWEIAGHIAVWMEFPLARVRGTAADELSPSENFPTAPSRPNENAWEALKARIHRAAEAWYTELEKYNDDALNAPREGKYPSVAEVMYGVVQHNAYHGGQIAVLKKGV